ncbi:MAG: ABC transporter substrate binding protein, partial [Hyphomicrobiales bacterium]
TDNTVVSALEAIVAVAEQNKLPFYTADTDSVARGAMASIGFNYYDVGKQAAEMVVRVLKGEKPAEMAVEFANGTDLVVNKKAAAAMGVTLPEAVIARASKVVE